VTGHAPRRVDARVPSWASPAQISSASRRATSSGKLRWPGCARRSRQSSGRRRQHVLRIGLISDTHNLLRPQAVSFLRGCDHIVHAGDVTSPTVLRELTALAPVTAVRGNNDKGSWASGLRETELIRFEEIFVYVIHDVEQLDIEPGGAGVRAVVFGHSHKPSMAERDGVLFINPGSAGPRRFELPVSVAELIVSGSEVSGRTIELVVQHGT